MKSKWVFVNYSTGELVSMAEEMTKENAIQAVIKECMFDANIEQYVIFSDISKVIQIKGGN